MRPFRDRLDILDIGLLYLMLAFVLGVLLGAGPAGVASVLSFALFDLIFIPPYYALTIRRTDHLIALVAYLAVSITTARLIARVREQTEAALHEQRRTRLLYDLNAILVGGITLDAILGAIVAQIVRVYGAAGCRMLLPDPGGELMVQASYPSKSSGSIDRTHRAFAAYAMETGEPAGRGRVGHRLRFPHPPMHKNSLMSRSDAADVLYVPIATGGRSIGVLEVSGRPGNRAFPSDDVKLLTTFAGQAALALERARLSEEATRASALAQSDELKSALLAAVSHDLRTPLAAIKASATSLLDTSVDWDGASQTAFLEAIDAETDRLTRMIENLLDLSRIEGGALQPDRDWYDLGELLEEVAERLRRRSSAHIVNVDIAAEEPPVFLDYVKIAQVLVNLGENALNYTPPGSTLTFRSRRTLAGTEILVIDDGPGIAASQLPRLFDSFYRVMPGSGVSGSGLGLAIARGFVDAHGGTISASSILGSGTTFHIILPDPAAGLPTERGRDA